MYLPHILWSSARTEIRYRPAGRVTVLRVWSPSRTIGLLLSVLSAFGSFGSLVLSRLMM